MWTEELHNVTHAPSKTGLTDAANGTLNNGAVAFLVSESKDDYGTLSAVTGSICGGED